MFEIEDKVIYGSVGVCTVEDINTPPIHGVAGDYYFLQPVYDNKGIIYSPVENKVPMRAIMSSVECNELIELAQDCEDNESLNEEVKPILYDDVIKSQDAFSLLRLIRCLFNIKNQREKDLKKMKSVDNKFLNTARSLLYGEMAVSLNKDYDEISSKMDSFLSI